MKNIIFRSGVVAAALALVIGLGVVGSAQAASNKYSFVARGIITDFDEANKTIKVDVNKVDGRGKTDMEGSNLEFIIGKAKVVKVASGKDTNVTYRKLAIGQEVAMKGLAKDDDTYTASLIRISDRSFTIVGLLKAFDKNAHTLKIAAINSTYKPASHKNGVEINMTFNDDTKFRVKNTIAITPSDVNADDQKVRVIGTLDGASNWKVTTFVDKYTGK